MVKINLHFIERVMLNDVGFLGCFFIACGRIVYN